MMLCPPKLVQIWTNLKLQRNWKNCCNQANTRLSAQFGCRFQFWSPSLVPNCPNWLETLFHQGLDSFAVFRKKNPSPYGRECPYGDNSPRSRDVRVCEAILAKNSEQ